MVKINSIYVSSDGQRFRVINTIEIEGKKWVYYRLENSDQEPREFSCYEESFLARFMPYTNER
jgi:hypothetical protein